MSSGEPETQTTTFGWHGIEVHVPSDWDLGAYSGNERSGSATLDDGEQVRLRVNWSDGKRATLEKALSRYRRSLRKTMKGSVEFERLEPTFFPKSFRDGKDILPFRWKTEDITYGALWKCLDCHRLVLVEVRVAETKAARKLARSVLCSALDHRDDGARLWCVYGFAFRTPDSYNLEHSGLHSGRLQFSFSGPKRSWLRVERWAMAREWLRKAPLSDWPAEWLKLLKLKRARLLRTEEVRFRGHAGCRFEADYREDGWRGAVLRPRDAHGLIWHCPDDDKVFAVAGRTLEEEGSLVDEVAAGIDCAPQATQNE